MAKLEGYFQKDVQVLTGRITIDGRTCEQCDARLVAECIALRTSLLLDIFEDERSALGFRRAYLSQQAIDAKSYFQGTKAIYKALVSEEFLDSGNWAVFKQQLASAPSWLVTPLLHHLSDGEVTVSDFMSAMQWARFDSHMSFRGTAPTPELIEYLDDEFRFSEMEIGEDVCASLNSIIREWCETFPDEATPFRGCHSSGAVTGIPRKDATFRRKNEKLVMDAKSKTYVRLRTGWDESPFTLTVARDDTLDHEAFVPDGEASPIRVIAVPKDPSKRRIVAPEGPMQMFLQSDAAAMITKWMNTFHWCDLHDQSRNRDACLRASLQGSHVTVDLSKASDYVRHSQLAIIYRDTPLWPLYDLTRSERAVVRLSKTDIVEIPLEKASPMGSKMCFPDMTIVLGSACELSVRMEKGRISRSGDFWVYGDDIIIRADCYDRLRIILSMLRFVVNDDKTFAGQGPLKFREACGMFAVNGQNVTPFQISRKYIGVLNVIGTERWSKRVKLMVPSAAPTLGLVDMLNRLTVSGLWHTRRALLSMVCCKPWLKRMWRITLSDFRADEARINKGMTPMFDCPCPTLITFDHVDANWQFKTRKGREIPNRPGVLDTSLPHKEVGVLTVATRPRKSPMDSIDYFTWECAQSDGRVFHDPTDYSWGGHYTFRKYGNHIVLVDLRLSAEAAPLALSGTARLTYSGSGRLQWDVTSQK